ncbi:MAG TPA: glycosyltransferase [Gammaproteobacteria bacterium]
MSNILVLNITLPYPANYNGNTIRVFPLSKELSSEHNCFLAVFDDDQARIEALKQTNVYDDILVLPNKTGGCSPLRHLFYKTGASFRKSSPAYYAHIVSLLSGYIEKHNIEFIIVHTLSASEFVQPFTNIPKLVDDIDCKTLSVQRRYQYLGQPAGLIARLKQHIEMIRAQYQESNLAKHFDFVTTISPVDRKVLSDLNKGADDRIFDIPNGFLPELLDYKIPAMQMSRSIAFWGSLDFPPNSSAVQYFFENVYKPYLSDKNIDWYIIGRNASEDIVRMGEEYENIKVTGFVDDLFALVSRIPIMINPMQMGGGLKNKVLEAFALGRLVISNEMGIEAVPATKNRHYIGANTPEEFSGAILRYLDEAESARAIGLEAQRYVRANYNWQALGQRFNRLIKAVSTSD